MRSVTNAAKRLGDTRAGHYEARAADQGRRGEAADTEASPADVRDSNYRTLPAAREPWLRKRRSRRAGWRCYPKYLFGILVCKLAINRLELPANKPFKMFVDFGVERQWIKLFEKS